MRAGDRGDPVPPSCHGQNSPNNSRQRRSIVSKRLQGKRALVTGASSGIGREVALRFAAEGAVVACGGGDPERTEREGAHTRGGGGGKAFEPLGDVSTPDGAEQADSGAAEPTGGLDLLVSNAGTDATEWP